MTHLLSVLIKQTDNLIVLLLQKLEISAAELESRLKNELDKIPQITQGLSQHYLSDQLNKVINQADKEAAKREACLTLPIFLTSHTRGRF
ncbi:hypothetical protein KKF32_04705 [Patescibacteria group bacterium]|nr:hypothetical protein [Patescibacteria group bacterium]